jgi:hypothetical protein
VLSGPVFGNVFELENDACFFAVLAGGGRGFFIFGFVVFFAFGSWQQRLPIFFRN